MEMTKATMAMTSSAVGEAKEPTWGPLTQMTRNVDVAVYDQRAVRAGYEMRKSH
jgi:hypothetical protein